MFDVNSTELLLLGAVAIAVIPPKDLPRAMRFAGQWIGKARGMARHFRSGLDEMVRQAELEEIEKKWREENERIMREHPLHDAIEHPADEPVMTALPAPDAAPVDAGPHALHLSAPSVAEIDGESPPAAADGNPAPKAKRAAKVAPAPPEPIAIAEDAGPELPLGLPPKQ